MYTHSARQDSVIKEEKLLPTLHYEFNYGKKQKQNHPFLYL